MQLVCTTTRKSFTVSEQEKLLRQQLDLPPPRHHPEIRFRHLLAFWPQFNLHRRRCDHSGNEIVSVYRPDCPYPVWHRDAWTQNANPPQAQFNSGRPFFEQLWELFQACPIPHNVGLHNENCEYTDDWWNSRNCYLCHNGLECEDCYYCYRIGWTRDSQYAVFSIHCELCRDVINCDSCFAVIFSAFSRQCRDSAFLFDCRNCSDCLFCWNLRNKRFCIGNEQLSEAEYRRRRAEYDFGSRQVYGQAVQRFLEILQTKAFWRATHNEFTENCLGTYLDHSRNLENAFFSNYAEDCVNCFRGAHFKSAVDGVCLYEAERIGVSSMPQDRCYNVRFCHNVMQCSDLDYCSTCYQCEYCFGCCGLVGKKFHIFNRPYSEHDYCQEVTRIREKMMDEGSWGEFFPPHFAPHPYDESLAGFHYPLAANAKQELGFRLAAELPQRDSGYPSIDQVPDHVSQLTDQTSQMTFFDPVANRPMRISEFDVTFSKKLGVPLPDRYYLRRMRDLFALVPFAGGMRETTCALTGKRIVTALPTWLDGRIVDIAAYEQRIHS